MAKTPKLINPKIIGVKIVGRGPDREEIPIIARADGGLIPRQLGGPTQDNVPAML